MTITEQINQYIASQPEPKRNDMQALHQHIRQTLPGARLWFLDGKNEEGKIVSNPSVGYGTRTIQYTNGTSREFYQTGMSANTTGISVYILGIEDKNYLARTYGKSIGKASITGYCIKFKRLKDIAPDILQTAIQDGAAQTLK